MGNELLTGFLAGQSDNNNGNNGNGFFGNEGLWAVIILAIIFGWGNNGNGFGSRNGGGNGGDNVTVVPYPAPGCYGGFGGGYPTEAVLQRALDTQTIISKLDGNTQGLCDGFYAQSNAINGLGTTIMQTAAQAELSRANQQAALMQQLCNLGYQQKDCCCETQRSIDNVRFTIAQEDCATRNLMQSNTRDVIENQNANARAVLDALTAQRLEAKDERIAAQAAQIQALQLAASQANQNAAIGAMISASEATILRRTGAECPTPAYVVQPPTPVNFPTNCCGQFSGWGNNGCGNCGSC